MKALISTLTAAVLLAGCSSTDDRDAYAGLPVASDPVGAVVYVGRVRVGTTPVNIPDSAWERAGGRVGNVGILRLISPGCQLRTVPVDLAKFQSDIQVGMNCNGDESYQPSDLGFVESRSVGQIVRGEDNRLNATTLAELRRDELHVLYAENRLDDAAFRASLQALR
ncbi:hypothetical protein GH975_03650 [Litorivicinus lipolyticus]|uniref:Lipoprotein n=1 Tax=Litorivicinus lipolyticus TaxID=418701 RepID=A0A5Q2Q694_9GAMM|nr:hypothetical protein [Litorivicinus lipolyticus]QGG79709.1 hypothetical protein GH975_03650 [Litorivicinus lipolyticus]